MRAREQADLISVLSRCSCAVFDCDGVLLDSNPVKVAAFRAALAGEDPAVVEAFVAEHRRTGGVSRYAKLERFYREIVNVADPDRAIAAALERFAAAAREGLRHCPEVPGIRAVLQRLSDREVARYVVSGGDEAEVREALLEHGLGAGWSGVFGSPTPKRAHFERLRANGELPAGSVYLGDAELDMRLADEFGLEFVFVAKVSDWSVGREVAAARGHLVIEDFAAVQ